MRVREKEEQENQYERVFHEFEPVYDENSRILILGSFPSVKSRENNFYYGHPQNRFWKVLAHLCECPLPQSVEEKKEMLLKNRIAVWDVISACEIIGSSDSSIRNVIPADILSVVSGSCISKIYANGKTAKKLYDKYCRKTTGKEICGLPSTSPANASYSLEKLVNCWKVIKEEV